MAARPMTCSASIERDSSIVGISETWLNEPTADSE